MSGLPINQVICGDCIEVLKDLPDNSIDSCVTDPPYGIGFMGKKWDRALPPKEAFQQILRVLKYGALAFVMSSPRQDVLWRMLRMLEECGFQLKQSFISWIYKTGFPKAYDVSKGIDKRNARRREEYEALGIYLKEMRIKKGLTQKDMAKHFLSKTGGVTGCVSNWESGNSVPTKKDWKKLEEMLDLHNRFDELIERYEAERRNVGKGQAGLGKGIPAHNGGFKPNYDLTMPSLIEAKKWQGWKNIAGLKPALECILMVNKPLSEKTIVDNVLKHGVGAINVDACRIPFQENDDILVKNPHTTHKEEATYEAYHKRGTTVYEVPKGRFPANLLVSNKALDTGKITKSGAKKPHHIMKHEQVTAYGKFNPVSGYTIPEDVGGQSRYFDLDAWAKHHGFLDVPKASKQERDKGLECLKEVVRSGLPLRDGSGDYVKNIGGDGSKSTRRTKAKNIHPTVKPILLGAYLVELGCPPDGVVVDPFCGTGSFLIGAHKLNRRWIGIDVEPEYVRIAKNRLSTLSQKLDVALYGSKTNNGS